MSTLSYVCIVTHDNGLRNLLEQIFIIRGDPIVIVRTLQDAEIAIERWDSATCRLVIIDTAALGRCETEQKHTACRILEDWTTTYPTLPFVFLGTLLQKYALLAIRADIMRFIVKPFRLDDLIDAIEDFCPLISCQTG